MPKNFLIYCCWIGNRYRRIRILNTKNASNWDPIPYMSSVCMDVVRKSSYYVSIQLFRSDSSTNVAFICSPYSWAWNERFLEFCYQNHVLSLISFECLRHLIRKPSSAILPSFAVCSVCLKFFVRVFTWNFHCYFNFNERPKARKKNDKWSGEKMMSWKPRLGMLQ